jgi:hypothetical protein
MMKLLFRYTALLLIGWSGAGPALPAAHISNNED